MGQTPSEADLAAVMETIQQGKSFLKQETAPKEPLASAERAEKLRLEGLLPSEQDSQKQRACGVITLVFVRVCVFVKLQETKHSSVVCGKWPLTGNTHTPHTPHTENRRLNDMSNLNHAT